MRFIQQPMDEFFFSKDGRNHKKMYIFLMAKTTINIHTVENVMKKEKR